MITSGRDRIEKNERQVERQITKNYTFKMDDCTLQYPASDAQGDQYQHGFD